MTNFKTSILILTVAIATGCKTVSIQGKKIPYKDICGDCNPGNFGPYMVLKKKTYEPQLEETSNPKTIAFNILGYVYPENNLRANIKLPCSSNSVISPFTIDKVKPLATTGLDGTSVEYNVKEKLDIKVSVAVESDLANIKAANPAITQTVLDDFKAKLTTAYSRFADKELTINGKYYQFGIDDNVVIEIAKNLNYKDCAEYMNTVTENGTKRMITSIGLVYFEIRTSENSVDEIASQLAGDAKTSGITFNVSAEFKRNISRSLKKVTSNYYQIITWRTVGVDDLKSLR
jgi:biopolymer transport protein ExbD